MECGNCSCRQGRDCPNYQPKDNCILRFVKRYDAEILAAVLVAIFLVCTGYITESERRIEIAKLCADRLGLPECDTIPKPKE